MTADQEDNVIYTNQIEKIGFYSDYIQNRVARCKRRHLIKAKYVRKVWKSWKSHHAINCILLFLLPCWKKKKRLWHVVGHTVHYSFVFFMSDLFCIFKTFFKHSFLWVVFIFSLRTSEFTQKLHILGFCMWTILKSGWDVKCPPTLECPMNWQHLSTGKYSRHEMHPVKTANLRGCFTVGNVYYSRVQISTQVFLFFLFLPPSSCSAVYGWTGAC